MVLGQVATEVALELDVVETMPFAHELLLNTLLAESAAPALEV